MDLNMAELLCGDEFSAEESSLNGKNSLQGLFSGEGIIPERRIFCPGMHSFLSRDVFEIENSILKSIRGARRGNSAFGQGFQHLQILFYMRSVHGNGGCGIV